MVFYLKKGLTFAKPFFPKKLKTYFYNYFYLFFFGGVFLF